MQKIKVLFYIKYLNNEIIFLINRNFLVIHIFKI